MRPINFVRYALQQASAVRFRIALTLIILICVTGFFCKQYQSRRPLAPSAPFAKRALAMCRAITGSCDAVTAPRLYDASVPLPGTARGNRRLWSVSCQSEGRNLVLLFNEKTGQICCAFGDTHFSSSSGSTNAGIATQAEALHIAQLRLKQLEMIAPNATYTLTARPKLVREETAWEIEWQTRHTGDNAPRRLGMVINREDGFPLHINDLYEFQRCASK